MYSLGRTGCGARYSTQEKLGAAEDARKTAEEAWLVEKASWKAALEDVTRERDALLSNTFAQETFMATPGDLTP